MEPLSAWTLLRSVLKVKKVAYFLSEVNKASKCRCVEHLLLGAVDYEDLQFWSCKVWHQCCQGWQWGQMQLWGLLKFWGIQGDARMQRCEKPKDTKVRMGQSLWISKVLWGQSFTFVGFCHIRLFCGRFLTPLVSLHTFHRPSTSRKCMNSQKADLSMPVTQRGWCDSHRSVTLLYSPCVLQGDSLTVTVTAVYTSRLFTQLMAPAKLHSIARRAFLRMHLETCIGLCQRHVVRWKQWRALQFSWVTKMVSSSTQLPRYIAMFF